MRALSILVFLQFVLASFVSVAEPAQHEIKVYRDPDCQCCHKWINHLEQNKFNVIDVLTRNMSEVKSAVKLPSKMASCHTAVIDGYVIEGHVPAEEIYRLLTERPDIAGLSVPQMPLGTPGMEMGERKDPFIVFQFDKSGQYSVFSRYELDEHNQYLKHQGHEKH